jgi:glyoxylase-like metal-dependent hydrolase (beta-lactamase superfamily II)
MNGANVGGALAVGCSGCPLFFLSPCRRHQCLAITLTGGRRVPSDEKHDIMSRRVLRKACAIAAVATTACVMSAHGQDTTRASAAAAARYAVAMSLPSAERAMKEHAIAVAPRVHVLHAALGFGPSPLANETVIEQSDGLVLIDAGKTRGAGERIVALIRGISAKPVKAVIITHWHQDHVLGLGPIVEAWPRAVVVSSRATLQHILTDDSYATTPRAGVDTKAHDNARAEVLRGYANDLGPNLDDRTLSAEEHRGWADVIGVLSLRIADERGTYLVPPTVTFDDKWVMDDAVAPVEARFIGAAHTDGDIVAWMPKQRVVAAGDMVVSPIPYSGTNVLDWPGTLRGLEALRPRVIVPGHGDVQRDLRYVDLTIEALDAMRQKASTLLSGPVLSDSIAQTRLEFPAFRRRFAGSDRWLGYWFDQYFAPNAVAAYTELRER